MKRNFNLKSISDAVHKEHALLAIRWWQTPIHDGVSRMLLRPLTNDDYQSFIAKAAASARRTQANGFRAAKKPTRAQREKERKREERNRAEGLRKHVIAGCEIVAPGSKRETFEIPGSGTNRLRLPDSVPGRCLEVSIGEGQLFVDEDFFYEVEPGLAQDDAPKAKRYLVRTEGVWPSGQEISITYSPMDCLAVFDPLIPAENTLNPDEFDGLLSELLGSKEVANEIWSCALQEGDYRESEAQEHEKNFAAVFVGCSETATS